LRGELLIRSLTARAEDVFTPGRILFASADPDAPPLTLSTARTTHDGWLIGLTGVADRTAAERWRGTELWAEHDEQTALGGDAPFAGDLVGLSMHLLDGTVIGTVSNYFDLPQGPVLEVERADDSVLFPLRSEFVARIDTDRRIIVVDPPTGLFD
jgi:16S rRNA processing protein RimM